MGVFNQAETTGCNLPYPLLPKETREVRLEIRKNGVWTDLGWSTTFRVAEWNDSTGVTYRLRHGNAAMSEGLIRKSPDAKQFPCWPVTVKP